MHRLVARSRIARLCAVETAADASPMAARIAACDWSEHPFGPIDGWPRALRGVMRFMLDAAFPAALLLGPELRFFYNDAYAPILGPRHPEALGLPGRAVWGELWDVIGPQFDAVMATGKGFSAKAQLLTMTRFDYEEETYWDYSFSPLTDDAGTVMGVFCEANDVTAMVLQGRHDRLMIALDEHLMSAESTDAMIDAALRLIGEHLGAKRTGFGEIDRAAHMLDIRRCWASAEMPDICGSYLLGTFGRISEELRQGQSVRIEDNLTDPRTDDAKTLAAYARIGLRSGIVTPIIERGDYAGGIFVQDNVPRIWSGAQTALIEAATARLWQAIQRRRAEARLRDSEQRFRLIFEQANDIVFTVDTAQRITAANRAGAQALGLAPEAIIGRSIADFVSPQDLEQTGPMLRYELGGGGNARHEVGVIGAGGRAMRWENNSTLIVDRDNKPIGLLSISRDVTERRAFEERQQLLINELNHRVKNTLSLVQGIAHQSFRPGADASMAAANFEARLAALATAHDLLTRDQWEGATIGDLVAAAIAPLGGADNQISAEGPMLLVTPKAAVAIAMGMHELATNAIKYGALSTPAGRVGISWEDRGNNRFGLTWIESGGPTVVAPSRRGFGIKMIERVLASDLGGTVKLQFASGGLTCAIDAMLSGARE